MSQTEATQPPQVGGLALTNLLGLEVASQAGIKLNGTACKCVNCGAVNYYHRAGCHCWDMIKMASDDEYANTRAMEYGAFYEKNNTLFFISYADCLTIIKNGGRVFDGENKLTEADFTSA